MIWYLPLEPLEMRYTKMQDEVTQKAFRKVGFDYKPIYGTSLTSDIKTGAFLDANSTNHYKFSQLMEVTKLFNAGKIKPGDSFYVSDLWFPGIEAIKYMAFFNKVEPVYVFGILHAGSFTPTDYVNQLKYWAKDLELSWIKYADGIFLGSEQGRQDIIKTFNIEYPELEKLHVTGLAFDTERLEKYKIPWEEKEDIIIFPHRLDKEKQPAVMEAIEKFFPTVEVIYTHKKKYPKDEYYKILAKSKVLFSASLQENFGYSVLEAITLGVNPILPINNTNYKYIYPKEVLYTSVEDAISKITYYLSHQIDLSETAYFYNGSIDRQVEIMKLVMGKTIK